MDTYSFETEVLHETSGVAMTVTVTLECDDPEAVMSDPLLLWEAIKDDLSVIPLAYECIDEDDDEDEDDA